MAYVCLGAVATYYTVGVHAMGDMVLVVWMSSVHMTSMTKIYEEIMNKLHKKYIADQLQLAMNRL